MQASLSFTQLRPGLLVWVMDGDTEQAIDVWSGHVEADAIYTVKLEGGVTVARSAVFLSREAALVAAIQRLRSDLGILEEELRRERGDK